MRVLELPEIKTVSGGFDDPTMTLPTVYAQPPASSPDYDPWAWGVPDYGGIGGPTFPVLTGGGGGGESPDDGADDDDDMCGIDASEYPAGVDATELNQLAWEAYSDIADAVGNNNQEGLVPLYQSPSGELVAGDMIMGQVAPAGEIPSVPVTPGMLTIGAPGELVGLVHNHPSGVPLPSTGDASWFAAAESIYFQGIDNNLVLFVGANVATGTPDGPTTTPHLTANTADGSSSEINEDGTSACSA
ncbi:hypothetical protein [Henriciella aquimarina]|uniref:hypothetical protein n=1 Tax=Henriciella aquimarina TaxID=545261 RepID=UPI000A017E1B|nr:hypothetical protein [Henriciella aquimarina]